MRKALVAACVVGLASAAAPAPLVAQKVSGHVELSADQKKTMHWGCVNACKPSPIESKCATACEAAMYKCIDETGPNETPKDTEKCQAKVLKLFEETKGVKKEEKKEDKKEAKKEEKKADAKKEEKKAKMFMQLVHDGDEVETAAGGVDVETDADTKDDEAEDSTEDSAEASEEDAPAAEEETTAPVEQEESSNTEDESLMQTSKGSDDDHGKETVAIVETAPVDAAADQPFPALQSLQPPADFDDDFVKDENSDTAAWTAAKISTVPAPQAETADEAEETTSTDDAEETTDDAEETTDEVEKTEETTDEAEATTEEAEDSEDPAAESLVQVDSSWKPEPCGELEAGVPCTKLYEHPQGSTFVTACPVGDQTNPESCGAYFGEKAAADQCPQITCPKALGVTMKLVCGGGCCPSCWAPDHVIKLDRHTSVDDAAVVDSAPQAPSTCGGVKCFKLACAAGFTEGFVNGACCNSCVQGR